MTLPQDVSQLVSDRYTIRTINRSELAIAVEWAAAEGWNPGLHDADCFYAADPNGFLMGFLDGKPIASISVVKYGENFGFLGFYIVRPEYRGRGYGWKIWQAGLDYLAGRTIGLDGVLQQQNNYTKSGFTLAHRNIRYEGKVEREESAQPTDTAIRDANLVPLSAVAWETVFEYDSTIFLQERADFLERWISSPQHIAIGLESTSQQARGQLLGYGVLRPCQQGYKIGPLFADTPQAAETIFVALKARIEPSSPFYLDVPESNSAAVALAAKHQMTSVFETARMYTQSPPELPLQRTFGITTFELG